MPERRLESEDIDSSLNRVRGMAMPQLVWVNVEPGGSAPFAAYISNRLACEMPIPPGTREDELFISASAKLLKEAKRCWRYANSASFGAFADEVNLASVIDSLDVFPTDNRDLRDPASEQVRTLDEHVIALGIAIEMNSPGDGCEQQAHLFIRQRPGALLCLEKRTRWHRIMRNTGYC